MISPRQLEQLITEGVPVHRVARKFGVSSHEITRLCERYDIEIPTQLERDAPKRAVLFGLFSKGHTAMSAKATTGFSDSYVKKTYDEFYGVGAVPSKKVLKPEKNSRAGRFLVAMSKPINHKKAPQ